MVVGLDGGGESSRGVDLAKGFELARGGRLDGIFYSERGVDSDGGVRSDGGIDSEREVKSDSGLDHVGVRNRRGAEHRICWSRNGSNPRVRHTGVGWPATQTCRH